MAKRPPVKRELAATPGGQGAQVGQTVGARMGRRDGRAEVMQAGPSWARLTEAGFVAFVVLSKGHQPDGDGLQEWPDGRCELWRDAAVSPIAQERDQGQVGVRGRHCHSVNIY